MPRWLSTGLAAAFVPAMAPPAPGAEADAICFGGPIVTVDDRQPIAEAVPVKDGRIVAVGSRGDVESTQEGAATRMIDVAGRTMVPGFIDAHGHMWGAGVQAMAANLLSPPDGPVQSIADLQAQLPQWMATSNIARDFGVVIGFGYDDSQLMEMNHGQTLTEGQVPKLEALGIFPALFPMHTFYRSDWTVDTVLGPERTANISPTGWIMESGMCFSSHHDAPAAIPHRCRCCPPP